MRHVTRRTLPAAIAFALAVAAVAAAPAAADGAPKGMVAFFNSSGCPDGWSPAGYATGRLVVAVADGSKAGGQLGTPLTDGESRTHQHGYTAELRLNHKSIAGADGQNDQGAEHHHFDVTGSTDKGSTGLPLTQLVVCEKG